MARGPISGFMARHYRHSNAAVLMDAAQAYVAHMASGGFPICVVPMLHQDMRRIDAR